MDIINPFPTQTNFDATAAGVFWKHCSKRRNSSSWAILNLLSPQGLYPLISRDFIYFCLEVFKVVCCRVHVCGKRLSNIYLWETAWQFIFDIFPPRLVSRSFISTYKLFFYFFLFFKDWPSHRCCRFVVIGKVLNHFHYTI